MTIERLSRAALDSRVVVGADGLLADFNQAGVLDPLDVEAASTVARLCGETSDQVILGAAMAVRGTRFGHVCVRLDALREAVVVEGRSQEEVEDLPWPEPDDWAEELVSSELVGDGIGEEPLVLVDGRLYLQRYHRYEQQVARLIRERCAQPVRPLDPAADQLLGELLETAPADPQHRQLQAAKLALTRKVAVIAGGPGTGKTHTVSAILAALVAAAGDRPPVVGLCAPTGKAAARLGEAISGMAMTIGASPLVERLAAIEASTIHRLLGWTYGRAVFRHHAANPLPHDVVVVDEMSMVSLPLAAKLLSAVRPDASLVLVGDPFQLESIEAGTVLADIVGPGDEAGEAPMSRHVVVLDRGHRFEEHGVIAEFSDAVRRSDPDAAMELLASGDDRLRWVRDRSVPEFAELWDTVIEHRADLVRIAGRRGQEREALDSLAGLAVLCARKQGPDSVSRWRRDIEAELDLRFTGLRYKGEWYPGRPVMITSNDYNLKLYNGDIGVAAETDDGLQAVFERSNEIRRFPRTHLGEHTTVHAMTIHKSQGSQFEEVVVVLPDDASRLLTRELLYTAVTRARHRVWLLGTEHVVRRAVTRSVERASGLSPLLWGERVPRVEEGL